MCECKLFYCVTFVKCSRMLWQHYLFHSAALLHGFTRAIHICIHPWFGIFLYLKNYWLEVKFWILRMHFVGDPFLLHCIKTKGEVNINIFEGHGVYASVCIMKQNQRLYFCLILALFWYGMSCRLCNTIVIFEYFFLLLSNLIDFPSNCPVSKNLSNETDMKSA